MNFSALVNQFLLANKGVCIRLKESQSLTVSCKKKNPNQTIFCCQNNYYKFTAKNQQQYSTTSAFTSYMWFKSHLCAKSVHQQHVQLMKFVQRRTYTMWAWLKTPAFAYLPTGGKNVRCRQDTESSSRCALEPDSLHLRHSAERRRRRRERRRESTEGGT